jgi:malic enzyme
VEHGAHFLILHYPRPAPPQISATKNVGSAADLSIAYSPGVAEPCIEINRNPEAVYHYTAKGQLVGVITNGTAVLGLGNIGPLARGPQRKKMNVAGLGLGFFLMFSHHRIP